ncbi:MAG: NADH-quinone oxidoreductase subunit H [Kiritimatiellae bacterium]|nr:NADH-quinone oxidoreductase subunit H [Kiritimatiellia bacterium]
MKLVPIFAAALLAPLFAGIVNQTKAFFAGRRGPGLFRLYFELAKLMRKSCPRSATSTWIFDIAPAVSLAATLVATAMFPWGPGPGAFAPACAAVFFYLMATGRFFTVLGALDTGSAFEGMGASREMQFSALVEPALFVILGFLALLTGSSSLGGMLGGYDPSDWTHHSVSLVLAGVAFFTILLCESSRVPFDDPETHLELTMVHEAMVLDNAGPDLAFILYGAALRTMLLAAFLVAMLLPELDGGEWTRTGAIFGGVALVALAVGVIESIMARMRFTKTPQVLMATLMTSVLATLLFALFR